MESVSKNVMIDSQFPGVTLGVIIQSRGLIQIDAPPSPEDGRSWRASLMGLGGGHDRLLVNLDSHPDRTLGARAMDCTVIAHEKVAQVFRSRPSAFKAQGDDTGAEWENLPNLGGIRWSPPEITFTNNATIHWGETPLLLQHRPGPAAGAIWAVLPEEKVVFVGDAVLKDQPPFLANANLHDWLENLDILLSSEYKTYTLVSGRDGVVNAAAVKSQASFLKEVLKKLDKLATKKNAPEAIDALTQSLLGNFKFPAAYQKQYEQRLRHGLQHYYARHYQVSNTNSDEEN